MKRGWHLTIGALCAIAGIFFLLVGMGMYFFPTQGTSSSYGIIIMMLCTPIFLIPGLILLCLGWREVLREKMLEDLAGYLRLHRRIKVTEIARKIGKTEMETERMIAKCTERGLIKGYVDRETNEFFTDISLQEEIVVEKCPHCGGALSKRILKGETAKCDYCGKLISALDTPAQKPCPHCRSPLVFKDEYGKWFCPQCRLFF